MWWAYLIALLATVNLQKLLAVVRCSSVFVEPHGDYADGPMLVGTCAFRYGRQSMSSCPTRPGSPRR